MKPIESTGETSPYAEPKLATDRVSRCGFSLGKGGQLGFFFRVLSVMEKCEGRENLADLLSGSRDCYA